MMADGAAGGLRCSVHRARKGAALAGPGDEMAATTGDRGHLRASHADREQVIGTLKAAFVAGMLAKDEFDLRVGQTLASRTCAELAVLTADLPAGLAAAEPPARAQGGQPVRRPGRWIAVATVLYAAIWAYVLLLSPHGGDNQAAGALILGGFVVYLNVWIFAVGEMMLQRQDKRSAGQPPRRPGVGDPAARVAAA
jgi:Domain of unknown function (DUF1707)